MGVTEQIAAENMDEVMGISKKLMKMLAKHAKNKIQETYDRLMAADDPHNAATKELSKSLEKCQQQLSIAHVQGGISDKDYQTMLRQVGGMTRFATIEDAATRIGTMDIMTEHVKELNSRALSNPTKAADIMKDLPNDFFHTSAIPDLIIGQTNVKNLGISLTDDIKSIDMKNRLKDIFTVKKTGNRSIKSEREKATAKAFFKVKDRDDERMR